ncbi:hypothetical protein VNI00_010955 [Paramarasmius palmivorus]|uniref:Uncharacterized protein n=1 Tax=Paramarasmius palmivorus TaxID=297713 RepID=A0AAW0CD64_9AGAR
MSMSATQAKTKIPIPGEDLTLEEMNETLSLKYILKHQPFEDLPLQYYPNPSYNHKPPIFDYGVALTADQIMDYGRKTGIIPADMDHLTASHCTAVYGDICRTFNNRFNLWIPGKKVDIDTPYIKERVLLFKVSTNYDFRIPEDKVFDLLDNMEQVLGLPAKWYVSNDNRKLKRSYRIRVPPETNVEPTRPQVQKIRKPPATRNDI